MKTTEKGGHLVPQRMMFLIKKRALIKKSQENLSENKNNGIINAGFVGDDRSSISQDTNRIMADGPQTRACRLNG